MLYSVGDCVDCRPEYVASESRRVANQYRAQLQKSDRYSWILEDLLLNSVVQAESSDTELHASLKVWNTRNLDENGNPQCIRTIYLFQHMEEEVITSFAVNEEEELLYEWPCILLSGRHNSRYSFYVKSLPSTFLFGHYQSLCYLQYRGFNR